MEKIGIFEQLGSKMGMYFVVNCVHLLEKQLHMNTGGLR